MYNIYGELEKSSNNMVDLINETYKKSGIIRTIASGKVYKDKFFRKYLRQEEIPQEIEVPIIAIIDEIPFVREIDMAKYLNVSKQIVSHAKINKTPKINNTPIIWRSEINDR